MLAIWTGQRQGDLLQLPWSAYDGTRFQQSNRQTHSNAGRRAASRHSKASDKEQARVAVSPYRALFFHFFPEPVDAFLHSDRHAKLLL